MKVSRDFQIRGDGNAVGENNHIFIDKSTKYFNKAPRNNNGSRKEQQDDSSQIFAFGMGGAVAIAMAAWKFAFYANTIYLTLISITFLLIISQLAATAAGIWRNVDPNWIAERVSAAVAALVLALAIYWSRSIYPDDLSSMAAKSDGWRDFICGLSVYGHQISILQMLSVCFIAIPCALLLMGNSVAALADTLSLATGWAWPQQISTKLGRKKVLIIGALFSVLAAISQTSVVFDFWASTILTQDRDPFAAKDRGFSFCQSVR